MKYIPFLLLLAVNASAQVTNAVLDMSGPPSYSQTASDAKYVWKAGNSNGVMTGALTASSVTLTLGNAGIRWADGSVSTTAAAGSLAFSGSGTTNTIAKFTGATAVGNSQITDNGSAVAVTGSAFSVGGSTIVVTGGLVGIRKTPALPLDVALPTSGNGTANNPIIGFERAGGAVAGIIGYRDTAPVGMYIGASSNHGFAIRTVNTDRIIADTVGGVTIPGSAFSVGGSTLVVTQGKVGVGMTPELGTLNVKSDDQAAVGGIYLAPSGNTLVGGRLSYTNSGQTGLLIDNIRDNAAAYMKFRMRTLGTPVEAMTILGSGNVGIGTTAPSAKVHMSSGTVLVDGLAAMLQIVKGAGSSVTGYAIDIDSASVGGEHIFGIHNDGHFSLGGYASAVGTCTNGAIVTNSHDSAGGVSFTGTNSSCAVTFGHAYDATPFCVLTLQTGSLGPVPTLSALSTTGFTIAPNSGNFVNGDRVNYICMGAHE